MKKHLGILIGFVLFFNTVYSQGKKTYMDSIFYDTFNINKVLINSLLINSSINEFKKNIKRFKFIDRYSEKQFTDGDGSDKEYLKVCFIDNSCNSNYIFQAKYDKLDTFKTISLFFEIPMLIEINNKKISIKKDPLNILKNYFPNSYNYYIKQKEHKFKDICICIKLVDIHNNRKIVFGIDEEKNIINSIYIDEIE